jgi:thymidylate synthase
VRSFTEGNFDYLFAKVVGSINKWPDHECSPRGQRIKEILVPTLVLENPRARLLANPARKADYGFAAGEFFWYWLGKQDLTSMEYYNRRMANFSDDGFTLNSAYGHRTRVASYGADGQWTQWSKCQLELIRDPDSRRAVLIIAAPADFVFGEDSKDVPCTLSLQFFVRDNRLHLHTHMRSNDAFWGLTYDLFSFTLLQECMMLELRAAGMDKLQLGSYTHTAGSLHIYERHFQQSAEVATAYLYSEFHPAAPMEPLDLGELALLANDEEALRTGKVAQIGEDGYTGGVRWLASQLNSHRRKRDGERGGKMGPGDGTGPALERADAGGGEPSLPAVDRDAVRAPSREPGSGA